MRQRNFADKAIVGKSKSGFRPRTKRVDLRPPEKPKEKKASRRRQAAKQLSPKLLEYMKGFQAEFIELYNRGDSIASIYRHFYENRSFTASENTIQVFANWLVSKRRIKRRKERLRGRSPGTGLQETTLFKLEPHREYILAAVRKKEPRSKMILHLARKGANVSGRTLDSYIAWLKKAK